MVWFMSQLLGLTSEKTLDVSFSFKIPSSFEEKSPDGWGYAFFNEGIWQSFKESLDVDKILRLSVKTMSAHKFRCSTFLSHIRYATLGQVTYENTHPFDRELYDSSWFFAHNGHLRLYRHIIDSMETFKPRGDTDSEAAFCMILEDMKSLGRMRNDKEIAKTIYNTAKELVKQGGLNFLLTNGEIFHAFYSGYKKLYFTTLRPPYPDVIVGENRQLKIALQTKNHDSPISIISCEPIIPEANWKEIEISSLYSFKNGQRIKYVF